MQAETEFKALRCDVDRALDDVLAAPAFRSSAQLQAFLRYVVEHSMAGEDNLLRERVIGATVFGRPPDYDTSNDPIVRIRAAELRKRLALVYQNPEFQKHVRLHMPVGSYRVQLGQFGAPQPVSEPFQDVPEKTPFALPGQAHAKRIWVWLAVGLLATMAVVTAAALLRNRPLHAFWAPFAQGNSSTLIVSGSNAVYRFSDELMDRYAQEHGLRSQGMEFFMDMPADGTVSTRDLGAAKSSFVALGDVQAVSVLVARLTREGGNFENRFPYDISFAELRKNPAILVGGFNNPLTMELTKDMRFVMTDRHHITDRQNPGKGWAIYQSKDPHDNTEDYAIATRLVGKDGEAPLLALAGIGQYGTVAAAEFVLSPSALEELDKWAGPGWQKRNLQVVLHLRVADFKNMRPEVVAVHTW